MVAGVPGYTSLWQLTLQAVQVKYGASSLNKATIAIDAKTKITTPLDTIQFATNSTFILLTPTRVSNIVSDEGKFFYSRPIFFSYVSFFDFLFLTLSVQ